MQYDFRTILKECTKVLLVWEKIRYLKRTSKAIQHFFWNGRLKKEQEVFSCESLCDFSYISSCVLFFLQIYYLYKRRYICSSMNWYLLSSQCIFPRCKITTKQHVLQIIFFSSFTLLIWSLQCRMCTTHPNGCIFSTCISGR